MALPPGFSNVQDWGAWGSWPTVNIGGFQYRQIPGQGVDADGRPFFVYDPNTNQILRNGDISQSQVDARKPKAPGTAQQIGVGVGGVVGTGAGIYGGKKVVDWYTSAGEEEAAQKGAEILAKVPSNIPGNIPTTPTAATPGIVQPATPQVVSAAPVAATPGIVSASPTVATPQIVGATGASGTVTGAGTGSTAATPLGASAYAGAALGVAGALWGGYQMSKQWGDRKPGRGALAGAAVGAGTLAAYGALAGTSLGPVGTLVGAGVGATIGAGLGQIKSGRHDDHEARSRLRDGLTQVGFAKRTTELGGDIDPEAVPNPTGTYVQLADGSLYDISGERKEKGYDVKEGPFQAQAIAYAAPIAAALTGPMGPKMHSDMTGYLANAIMSNSGGDLEVMRENASHLFNQLQMSPDDAKGFIDGLATKDKPSIDPTSVDVMKHNIDIITGRAEQEPIQAPMPQEPQQQAQQQQPYMVAHPKLPPGTAALPPGMAYSNRPAMLR